MKKILLVLTMAVASLGMHAQDDYGNFVRNESNYTNKYKNDQIIGLYQQHYGISQKNLNELYIGFNKNWGDVILGIELSHFLGVPINTIYTSYHQNGGSKGWGVLAQKQGIKPGSAKFHSFKQIMENKNVYWKDTYKDYAVHKNPKIAGRQHAIYPKKLMATPLSVNKQNNKNNRSRGKTIEKDQNKYDKSNGHENRR